MGARAVVLSGFYPVDVGQGRSILMHDAEGEDGREIDGVGEESEESLLSRRYSGVDHVRRQQWADSAKRRAQSLRNWCSDSPFVQTPLDTPVLKSGEAGIGIALFFHFVKEYAIAFGFLSIVSIFAAVEYGLGEGPNLPNAYYSTFNESPSGLVVISITNLGSQRPSTSLLVADLLASIFFLIFVYMQKHYEHERILTMRNFKVSSTYYTVEIRGLPKLSYKEKELTDFFSRFGTVYKSQIVALPPKLIELRALRSQARYQLEHSIAFESANAPNPWYYQIAGLDGRTDRATRRRGFFQKLGIGRDSFYWSQYIANLDSEIQEAEKNRPRPIGRAFIIFEDVQSAIHCKEVYMGTQLARTCELIWCYTGPPKFRFRTLEALDAPEPLDIIWENLGYGNFSRFSRQFMTFLVCGGVIGLGMVVNAEILDEEEDYNPGFPLAAAFLVGILNYGLTAFLCAVVPLERHHSHTGLQTGLSAKIFFVTLLNSLVSILLACLLATHEGLHQTRDLGWDDFYKIPDFVEGYTLVVLALVSGPLTRRLLQPLYYKYRIQFLLPGCFTRHDFDNAYKNPSFNLAEAYAFALEVIFISIALSPIAPIIVVFAFLGLVAHYWVCKYIILRVSGPPPPYEVKLALRLERLLPTCITLHLIVASFAYSTQGVSYEGSVLESVLTLNFLSRAFSEGDESQDYILVLYWALTGLLVLWHFVIPLTPLYWIFTWIKSYRHEHMIVTKKVMRMHPKKFSEALQIGDVSLYEPPVDEEDPEEDRGAKVEQYLQRSFQRLQVFPFCPQSFLSPAQCL
eukprot:TRINITY_DN5992_c0_g1_i2.p1 TRINITY_DN5992_c0_g1~~TRINITY_DN5992_c0_g1_i2.p1  ORF type:complete len:798 (+),score=108.58 TRINITY_DN5992_c0_g1_i2:83-2476(+)